MAQNLLGNSLLKTWNLLPAALTTLSNTLALKSSQDSYALYQQQAVEYINTATQNAQIIRQKGEIDLRNLKYRNALERGNDIATVGAKGGNMSGSNLDIMIQKEKVRKMNEAATVGNTETQAMIEMRNGYQNAARTYGRLSAKAQSDKWAFTAAIFKGLEMYVGSTLQDMKQMDAINNYKKELNLRVQSAYDRINNNVLGGAFGDFISQNSKYSGIDHIQDALRKNAPPADTGNIVLNSAENNINSSLTNTSLLNQNGVDWNNNSINFGT